MNIELRLNEIWKDERFKNLPQIVHERGFLFAQNNSQKDILITGINPSFRESDSKDSRFFDFNLVLSESRWDNYWGPVKKMVYDKSENIDLREHCAYLDILYFREKNQLFLKKELLLSNEGLHFVAAQINLSQHIIEEIIKPKVIVVKNKESHAYWGKYSQKGIYWMGYKLEALKKLYCGDLYKIVGLHNSNERIATEISKTNLENTIVLFSHHINQYTSKEKRLTAKTLNELLKIMTEPALLAQEIPKQVRDNAL